MCSTRRPEKTGWLFQSSRAEAAEGPTTERRVTFEVALSTSSVITIGFLKTYHDMGWLRCWVDGFLGGHEDVYINGGWGERVGISTVLERRIEITREFNPEWNKEKQHLQGFIRGWHIPPGRVERHNLTCEAQPPRRKKKRKGETGDWRFKIMHITSC